MTTAPPPTDNGPKSGGGRFQLGNPGGPGRPPGAKNKTTIMLDELADGDAETILRKQVEKAKEGDQRAAEFILGRAWPARRGRPAMIELPKIETAADIVTALGAVAGGEIMTEEGEG